MLDEQALRKVDLNSLVTFMVVYREKNVSRAAKQLGVTQPAVSNTLRELRCRFGDKLFIQRCRYMEPTVMALEIAALLGPAMYLIQTSLEFMIKYD
ncbi:MULTISPECIES: LysR family transcriptional regulator [unclassified Pseudomonas]|uniref:LysR family transcriptional regulator n=1 Tax=unclassified Pseudomonas TaxID=196821 RepID=UPI00114D1DFB|nr:MULTISPECIES: LysR family transcriptional regulator [unclassified Pseudomonas]QIH08036.1 LysR family transcriptional regulator [Pseudomonas sp. BIOMIG1BAC]UMZ15094.1 LysR family transcriptional regulator [Pseudomonas sp. MPFS]